ncbi:MAG: hypothetical protein RIC56_15895 [Pseudomonadales bacterium]
MTDDRHPGEPAFEDWCRQNRALLGRDRLRKPFLDGYEQGWIEAVREALRQERDTDGKAT